MNSRIREFERQSGIEIYGLGLDRAKWEHALEKFAELIIRESAAKVNNLYKQGGGTHGETILNHFDIKP